MFVRVSEVKSVGAGALRVPHTNGTLYATPLRITMRSVSLIVHNAYDLMRPHTHRETGNLPSIHYHRSDSKHQI